MRILAAWSLAAVLALAPAASARRPAAARRFLLYDLTAGEGFNLRRDAMLRAAMLVSDLGPGWTLVLPPFHRMVHWAHDPGEELLPWREFVDLSRLGEVVPVIEYEDFVEAHGRRVDRALVLTSGAPSGSGYRIEPRDCSTIDRFTQKYARVDGSYRARFFGGGVTIDAARVECLWSFAPYPYLVPFLTSGPDAATLVDGMTIPFWDTRYGGAAFWKIRTRIPFSRALTAEADRFIRAIFGAAPYLAIHVRRGDFLQTPRPHPTLDEVVAQIQALKTKTGVSQVFLATDSTPAEVAYLRQRAAFSTDAPLPGAAPPDGVLAVFDQIIASRAAWFAGTLNSTFTTTIFEEREILGRSPESTYNVLCTRGESTSRTGAYVCPPPNRIALVRSPADPARRER